MADSYQLTLIWPYLGASHVIVTGTFDNWSKSRILEKTPSGSFEGSVSVPYGKKTQYKFVVDGRWRTVDDHPTEYDSIGNLNNVFVAPERSAKVEENKGKPVEPVSEVSQPTPEAKPSSIAEHILNTTTGIVAAIRYATGSSANVDKAPPPACAEIEQASAPTSAPAPVEPVVPEPEVLAPDVPISILPVNAPSDAVPSEPKAEVEIPAEASTHVPEAPATLIIGEPEPEAPVPGSTTEPQPAAEVIETTKVVPAITEPPSDPQDEPPVVPSPAPIEASEPKINGTVIESPITSQPISEPNGGTTPHPPTPPTPAAALPNGTVIEKPATPEPAPVESPKPSQSTSETNGTASHRPSTPPSAVSAPATPMKKPFLQSVDSPNKHSRGSSVGSPSRASVDSSGRKTKSLRIGSLSFKKKKGGLFGRLKEIFHHHHDSHDKEGSKSH